MEIRIFRGCIYISCWAFIIIYPEAKSVSLNELIAAEKQTLRHSTTSRPTTSYTLKGTSLAPSIITPLQKRKTFEIKSPSKPNKFKLSQKLRRKTKNLTTKREINQNDKIIQKYIPLLKNLRMLFDNILGSESSENDEPKRDKFKRNSFDANEIQDVVCTCERKSQPLSESLAYEETSTITEAFSTTIQGESITIAPTTPAHIIINDNIRSIGRYKDIPLLPAGNPSSLWRNNSRLGQGSRPTFNRSIERHIPGDNGNNERNTGGETGSYTEDYEEYTNSYTRNDASRNRTSGQLRDFETHPENPEGDTGTNRIDIPERNKAIKIVARNVSEHEGEVEFKIRGDKTKSSLLIPELDPGLRGYTSQKANVSNRSEEINQKSVSEISTSDKRIPFRDGSFTTKNQEISASNKAIVSKHVMPNSTFPIGKVVVIFDGYSVAKDVNGDNKLTEKAIQIHA